MISFELNPDTKILIIKPSGALQKEDFESLTSEVDPFIETKGNLNGIVIHASTFPGWESFGALIDHMKFVKDHHKKVSRVALVIDGQMVSIAPRLATHFVAAEVKHFGYQNLDAALEWITQY